MNMTKEQLKAARHDLNITRGALANVLGIHYVTYVRYETGARQIPLDISKFVETLVLFNSMVPGAIDSLVKVQVSKTGS